ncbi:MAG TPA: riboflavin synthase [Desulfobacteraceae bacterium]|nr:riboflavin synthase [Deltaproteobacteria bacterium]HDI60748.1 riboflavin synthase [Desulfobacteraceae bacterium]
MFTGIIEGLGTIEAVQGRQLAISADFELDGTGIGDSIAVNGACLTVVRLDGRRFSVDLSPETAARTTLGRAAVAERVNLERALRLSDRLDGHLVLGHVDGIGTISGRRRQANALLVDIAVPEALARHLIEKGSVAVDGISLTVNRCNAGSFSVSIIPHTAQLTTVGFKPTGSPVNIETDIIGKYVEKFLKRAGTEGGVDMALLARAGYL